MNPPRRLRRDAAAEDPAGELARRQKHEQQRQRAATPKKLADVLPALMARRGYARVRSSANLDAAWLAAAGPVWANFTRPGKLSRGTLEVLVSNSTVLQELTFKQVELLTKLQKQAPDAGISRLRFRTGKIS